MTLKKSFELVNIRDRCGDGVQLLSAWRCVLVADSDEQSLLRSRAATGSIANGGHCRVGSCRWAAGVGRGKIVEISCPPPRLYMFAPHVLVTGKGSTGFLGVTMGICIGVKDDSGSQLEH